MNLIKFISLLCSDADLLLMSWCCTAVAGVVGDDDTDIAGETGDGATLDIVGDDDTDIAGRQVIEPLWR